MVQPNQPQIYLLTSDSHKLSSIDGECGAGCLPILRRSHTHTTASQVHRHTASQVHWYTATHNTGTQLHSFTGTHSLCHTPSHNSHTLCTGNAWQNIDYVSPSYESWTEGSVFNHLFTSTQSIQNGLVVKSAILAMLVLCVLWSEPLLQLLCKGQILLATAQ